MRNILTWCVCFFIYLADRKRANKQASKQASKQTYALGEKSLLLLSFMILDRDASRQASFGYLDRRADILPNKMNNSMHVCARRAGVVLCRIYGTGAEDEQLINL